MESQGRAPFLFCFNYSAREITIPRFNCPLGTKVPAPHPAHPPTSFSGIIEGKSGLHFKNRKSNLIPLNSSQ